MGASCPDEELLAAFVGRDLPEPSAQQVERHIDTCPACRGVVAELLRAQSAQGAPSREEDEAYLTTLPASGPPLPRPPLLVPGATVGRFRILERIGGGGMGVVFAAHDPKLDRKVALKLLRAELAQGAPGEEARARLLREAKAMARLAHPNVIGVHDVGTLGDEIFLAVEFVDGQTLGAWRKERPRSWRDVLAVYLQAGRGLAAAHEAGLVHRDFKPDNALVGRDGRVRVTDFGLVRSTSSPWPTLTPPPVPVGGEISLEDALTRAYALLGTPGYMAPEQLEGRPADERSDQFSFCVAVFEALFGQRPFRGENVQELRDAIRRARPVFPVRSPVPARVRRALARGLSPSPFDRHSSMDALLRELDSARRIARWWWYAGAGGAAAAGAAALVALWPARQEDCSPAARRWAGLWEPPQKEQVRGALEGSGASSRVEELLDTWVARFDAARSAVCALPGRSELAQRLACLDARARDLRAVVSVLSQKRASGTPARAAALLAPPEDCASPVALELPAPPDTPAAAGFEQARALLSEAKAYLGVGELARARELASRAQVEAVSSGLQALAAEAVYVRGSVEVEAESWDAAESLLDDAAVAAEAARQDGVAAMAEIALADVVGVQRGRAEEGLKRARRAQAKLDRTGTRGALQARLDAIVGKLAAAAGDAGSGPTAGHLAH